MDDEFIDLLSDFCGAVRSFAFRASLTVGTDAAGDLITQADALMDYLQGMKVAKLLSDTDDD